MTAEAVRFWGFSGRFLPFRASSIYMSGCIAPSVARGSVSASSPNSVLLGHGVYWLVLFSPFLVM